MDIIMYNVKELIPYNKNTKKHPKKQIQKIIQSIKEFGFNVPIVVDENKVIIAGHGRLLAATEIGMTEVPVIVRADLTEDQKKAYRIADNKTAESEWDFDFLKEEFSDLINDDYELEMTGFDMDEINDIMGNEELEEPEMDNPDEIDTDIVKGDIFELGNHRLMCGDSTMVDDFEKLMAGELVHLVFTDPPWNVNYGGNLACGKDKDRKIKNDSMSQEDFYKFLNGAYNCMNKFSHPGAMTYVVMSAQEWGTSMNALQNNNYHWSSTIIWVKSSLVISRKDYHTQYEPIWYGWKEGTRLHPLTDRKQSDVWKFDKAVNSKLHPTMKPIDLCGKAIQNSSNQNDNVLDLFGGSGSTLIACEQLNRKCYMMELDPKYVQTIINRWEKLTGKTAKKVE